MAVEEMVKQTQQWRWRLWSAGDVQDGLTRQPLEEKRQALEEKGVGELLKNFNVTEIPAYYIKPENMRQQSEPTLEAELSENHIPVVDLASSREDMVKAIGKACECGFFQLINHGTSSTLLRKILSEAKEFFALPVAEKLHCTTKWKMAGPIHFGGGTKGDWRDVLKITCAPPSAVAMDLWPNCPPGFRETIMHYVTHQQALVRRLLEIISEALGLESSYIATECRDPILYLGINHYPPCPDPSLTMGIPKHSDPNTITLLLQDETEGLQVYKDDVWIGVKPMANALFVNVGDHLEILSNDRYPSCVHRVVNNKLNPRTSIALFFSPSLEALIKPAPALIDEEHPAEYDESIYGDFLMDSILPELGPQQES